MGGSQAGAGCETLGADAPLSWWRWRRLAAMPRRPAAAPSAAALDRSVNFAPGHASPDTIHVYSSAAGYYVWNPVRRVSKGPYTLAEARHEERAMKMRFALDGVVVEPEAASRPPARRPSAPRVDLRQSSLFGQSKPNRRARYYVVDEPRVDPSRPFAVYDTESFGGAIGRYATRGMADRVASAESSAGPSGFEPAPPYFAWKGNRGGKRAPARRAKPRAARRR